MLGSFLLVKDIVEEGKGFANWFPLKSLPVFGNVRDCTGDELRLFKTSDQLLGIGEEQGLVEATLVVLIIKEMHSGLTVLLGLKKRGTMNVDTLMKDYFFSMF